MVDGTWMRYSCGSMERCTICGVLWITKARCSKSLILTRNAIRDLLSGGHIGEDDNAEATQFLREELGGEEVEEVHVRTHLREGERDVVVLGDSVRMICAVSETGEALVAKTIHTPYDPYLQREKQGAMRRRALWDVVDPREARGSPSNNREHVQSLLSELNSFEAADLVSEGRRRSKREVHHMYLNGH